MNTRSSFKGTLFGVGLCKARVASGLTQGEVAQRIGKRQTNISSWELGRSEPSLDILVQLLDLYSVSFEDVLNRTPHPATITSEEMQLILAFRRLSPQNKEAVEAIMAVYSKYQSEEER